MNGMELIVLAVLFLCAVIGYFRGFLRVVYSLAAWAALFLFVSWSSPYLSDLLKQNASFMDFIQEQCETYSSLPDIAAPLIAPFIADGIAFFLMLLVTGVILFWISRLVDLVSRIPIIRGPDRLLGAAAGALKGLLLVWIFFYFTDLCAVSESGQQLHMWIEESPFLKLLYENNPLLDLILQIIARHG